MSSLRAEGRCGCLRALRPVKRAFAGVQPKELHMAAILQACAHDHLLPLFGTAWTPPAGLVFPLMVGGSLRARMDRGADDLAYLSMGCWPGAAGVAHVAAEAARGGGAADTRISTRRLLETSEANILLDGNLYAYLGDTGFAKAHHSSEASRATKSTCLRARAPDGEVAVADEDVLNGSIRSVDNFAVGRTPSSC